MNSIATNLVDFINNMDDVRRHVHKSEKILDLHPPSIYASSEGYGRVLVYHYSNCEQNYLEQFLIGYLTEISSHLFHMECDADVVEERCETQSHAVISMKAVAKVSRQPSTTCPGVSDLCEELVVNPSCMDDIFPFHLILDRQLHMVQVGASLSCLIEPYIPTHGLDLRNYFRLVKPSGEFSYRTIENNFNTAFTLASLEGMFRDTFEHGVVLTGQISHLASSDTIWFITSPKVTYL